MVGCFKLNVVWAALKWSVVLERYVTENLPTHIVLWEFERAVLHKLTIQTSVGGIINIFEEQSIHRVLNLRSGFLGVDVHDVGLGTGNHRRSHCDSA